MDDGVPPGHRDPAAAIPASQARSWSKGYQHKTKIDGNEFYAGSGVSRQTALAHTNVRK